jgi:large subunit ribosomal protein L31
MKTKIHPQYFEESTVTCACGNSFQVGSTKESIRTELCSECHPFYTGKQKFVDTARRVEKFQAKLGRVKQASAIRKGKKVKRAAAKAKKDDDKKNEDKNESK